MSFLLRGELDGFGRHFGTDKASSAHDYLRFYEFYLTPIRAEAFTLLELGVGPSHHMGKSLLAWEAFFPNATIVGVDINLDAASLASDRIQIEVGDLGRLDFLEHLATKYRPQVIIDDASHTWAHQTLALERLFLSLVPGGIYIVEDLETSFGPLAERYGVNQYIDMYTYMSALCGLVCGGQAHHPSFERETPSAMQQALAREIDLISYSRHAAIVIRKA